MIPVTKPFLPPRVEYQKFLDEVWERNWLTNMGPLSTRLEEELKKYLNVDHLLFVTNGTIALQMAIKALDLKGEIITTPFSFVATSSTIVWEGCKPIFVDIDKESLCIDPTKIEEAITDKTSAILATHVYGNPCDVETIELIAKKYDLKVIYDGAHAFGVKINDKSLFEYGDISTCSLHATKLYHSVEGGFIVAREKQVYDKLSTIRNFGISSPETFSDLGINGKNSEFHAAMGLANLPYIEKIIEKRCSLIKYYDEKLKNLPIVLPKWHASATKNYAYYTIIFENEETLLRVKAILEKNQIIPRRYFYPSLSSSLPYINSIPMENSDNISRRVLCLPLYYDLLQDEVDLICEFISKGFE